MQSVEVTTDKIVEASSLPENVLNDNVKSFFKDQYW